MSRYGRLTVIKTKRLPSSEKDRKTKLVATCKCDCGRHVERTIKALKAGKTTSCGCSRKRKAKPDLRTRKAKSMLNYARARAKKKGLPFNIELDDVVIPDICPLLDIPLVLDNELFADNSPSLDRLIPSLGYVKGNVKVISVRANTIKNNATIDELMLLTERLHAIFTEG